MNLDTKVLIAERFKSVQGEGVYAGTPMAFIRFVGCSVGKKICQHCDTDFDAPMEWRGGGEYSIAELLRWAYPYEHICLTGGEPFDQPYLHYFAGTKIILGEVDIPYTPLIHVETSGTVIVPHDVHARRSSYWICVSPKPGYHEDTIRNADEIKVIVPGLGLITQSLTSLYTSDKNLWGSKDMRNFKWPGLVEALEWATKPISPTGTKIPVFLQPRNSKNEVDKTNLMYVMDLVREHPELRMSVQLHKILKVQ